MMGNIKNIQLQLQNTKLQLENIELQYKNNRLMSDFETVNISFEIIDIGLELLRVGLGINFNQIFQFQMQLQNIILKMQNLIQNQNMGMNPIINNNSFFNDGLGNVMNSNNPMKVNINFKTYKGNSTVIISNYETPINEVIEKFYNRFSFPIEKKKIRFLLNGCIIKENDHTSIGNYCLNNNNNLTIIVSDANNIIGG